MPKVLLVTLQTFSTTGGIQKMTRTLAHSLQKIATNNNWGFKLWSVYDQASDLMLRYMLPENFRGFGNKRAIFIWNVLKVARKEEVVILSHINLAIVGLIVKVINPTCQVWLIAHGIEVWRPLAFNKKTMLKKCDKIICVSNFTRQEMIRLHDVDASKCEVLNNAIDPFMALPETFKKPEHLLTRYRLTNHDVVIFTLTRLAATEQYKGYEQVIKTLSKLKINIPSIKYVLSGQYDATEEKRIRELIYKYKVEKEVILTGFVNEDELADHFLLADLFVLPSKKEGFGIVFIEALACGLPVICGNVDGSLDAIKNGELGQAINPDDLTELENTLTIYLNKSLTTAERKNLQIRCLYYFNEEDYIIKLQRLLKNEPIS
jgi:phosphatidylinositol alpha-1,6-mannosyltransferase